MVCGKREVGAFRVEVALGDAGPSARDFEVDRRFEEPLLEIPSGFVRELSEVLEANRGNGRGLSRGWRAHV